MEIELAGAGRGLIRIVSRWWRVLATGYCFALFGLGGLALALTVLPLARFSSRDPNEKNRRARAVTHLVFRFFIWQMRFVGVISVDVRHAERLKQSAGKLVVANHPSLIDVVLLISLLPKANCIVKPDLWKNPFLKGVVSATGYVSSNRSSSDLLNDCGSTLQNGYSLIVFPEGTRTLDDRALTFQRGAANIAVRCGVDVVPVTIHCEPKMLGKGTHWYQVPEQRGHYTLTVDDPIIVKRVTGEINEPALATRRFNKFLLEYYEGMLSNA